MWRRRCAAVTSAPSADPTGRRSDVLEVVAVDVAAAAAAQHRRWDDSVAWATDSIYS